MTRLPIKLIILVAAIHSGLVGCKPKENSGLKEYGNDKLQDCKDNYFLIKEKRTSGECTKLAEDLKARQNLSGVSGFGNFVVRPVLPYFGYMTISQLYDAKEQCFAEAYGNYDAGIKECNQKFGPGSLARPHAGVQTPEGRYADYSNTNPGGPSEGNLPVDPESGSGAFDDLGESSDYSSGDF